jgi:hypothetical protein
VLGEGKAEGDHLEHRLGAKHDEEREVGGAQPSLERGALEAGPQRHHRAAVGEDHAQYRQLEGAVLRDSDRKEPHWLLDRKAPEHARRVRLLEPDAPDERAARIRTGIYGPDALRLERKAPRARPARRARSIARSAIVARRIVAPGGVAAASEVASSVALDLGRRQRLGRQA